MSDKNAAMDSNGLPVKRKEIYTYEAPWMTYGLSWCRSREDTFRLAVGSFKEEYSNQIEIIQLYKDDKGVGTFKKLTSFEHPYPATKLMWAPPTIPNAEKVPLPHFLLTFNVSCCCYAVMLSCCIYYLMSSCVCVHCWSALPSSLMHQCPPSPSHTPLTPPSRTLPMRVVFRTGWWL